MKKNNNTLKGLEDKFGLNLLKYDYLTRLLSDTAHEFGYHQLEVPIIEHRDSFSEEIVGSSPWPEWNECGCFYLTVNNYNNSYDEVNEKVSALLIPEGTISVTRWLGNLIDSSESICFPIKIFYELPCFRNELINTLSQVKKRQFNQFGLEILGTSSVMSDIETFFIVHKMLSKFNISSNNIRIRFNNIQIFNKLIKESKIDDNDCIILKEILDTIAECKAGKDNHRYPEQEKYFWNIVSKYNLSEELKLCWSSIINHSDGMISKELYDIFSDDYKELFNTLNMFKTTFDRYNIRTHVDLSVIRSHEYYSGLSFEVDVIYDDKKFIEIGGGGRYDKLVENFVNNPNFSSIPCTGFAFGIERLISMMDELNLYPEYTSINSKFHFNNVNKALIIPKDNINPVESYLECINYAENNLHDSYLDVFVGVSSNDLDIDNYIKVNNISNVFKEGTINDFGRSF